MTDLVRKSPSDIVPATTRREVVRTCNPDEPLRSGDTRWEDFSMARGNKSTEALEDALLLRTPKHFVHAAFVSHRGAGKSTEILRLADRIRDAYELVYVDATIEMDPFNIEIDDLLFNLTVAVESTMRVRGTPLPDVLLERVRKWFEDIVRTTKWVDGFNADAASEFESKIASPFFGGIFGSIKALLRHERLEEASDRHVIFARMNIQRDELARDYALPWVIMIHPAAALEMTMRAPDLVHFAGCWQREEAQPASVRPPALEMRGQTGGVQLSSKLEMKEGSEILIEAQHALMLGQLDEAADLLAQIDMRDPNGRETDGFRLGLRGRLAWKRGEPEQALAHLEAARLASERVGDERGKAVTMGSVADILEARGELDEALRIRREEELPVYERLGDVRSQLVCRTNLAQSLASRGRAEDKPEIIQLLAQALADARRLRLPEVQDIETIIRAQGENPDAPPFTPT